MGLEIKIKIIYQHFVLLSGYKYLLGCDENSWGWDIPCKSLVHGGEFIGELSFSGEEEDLAKEGAIIESQVPRRLKMIIDIDNGTLSYDLGNDKVVTAFTGKFNG